jgi:hypothetical protein
MAVRLRPYLNAQSISTRLISRHLTSQNVQTAKARLRRAYCGHVPD